jgi:hypothetical protein
MSEVVICAGCYSIPCTQGVRKTNKLMVVVLCFAHSRKVKFTNKINFQIILDSKFQDLFINIFETP